MDYREHYMKADYRQWEGDWELIEGVKCYIIVNPQNKVAKAFRLYEDGRFVKQGDFTNESFEFTLEDCAFDFDFSKIWRK